MKYYSGPNSFHPKAYICKTHDNCAAIIGSSNLTASGLTTGTEWSIYVESRDLNCEIIVEEFKRLWNSEYSQFVTESLIDNIRNEKTIQKFNISLNKEDKYPTFQEPVTSQIDILNQIKNYVVTRKPDNKHTWNFQIYRKKLEGYISKRNFSLVIVCDKDTSGQKIFAIPSDYLKGNILPSAYFDDKGRYLFEIHKKTLRFNWHHRFGMNGERFLINLKKVQLIFIFLILGHGLNEKIRKITTFHPRVSGVFSVNCMNCIEDEPKIAYIDGIATVY